MLISHKISIYFGGLVGSLAQSLAALFSSFFAQSIAVSIGKFPDESATIPDMFAHAFKRKNEETQNNLHLMLFCSVTGGGYLDVTLTLLPKDVGDFSLVDEAFEHIPKLFPGCSKIQMTFSAPSPRFSLFLHRTTWHHNVKAFLVFDLLAGAIR